jgi:sulfatase modifying factor 1
MILCTIHRMLLRSAAVALFVWLTAFASAVQAVTMNWQPVVNAGNSGDNEPQGVFGAVAYGYRIGTYDVTNSQYAEFLNAKDASGANTLGLYNSGMGTDVDNGGISFNAGNASGSKYTLVAGHQNYPVTYVSWYDTLRFANWLNNGQGNGDTETGSYTLVGGTPTPSNGLAITRNPGAQVFLPSEDEWFKAAYYSPTAHTYLQFPAGSNIFPVGSNPTSTPNSANVPFGGPGHLTPVGGYTGSASANGAFDMGGNAWQWNEVLIGGLYRGLRGGSFYNAPNAMYIGFRFNDLPVDESAITGFRLASIPEPSTAVLAMVGAAALLWWSRRLKRHADARA